MAMAQHPVSTGDTFESRQEYLEARQQLEQQDQADWFDRSLTLSAKEKSLDTQLTSLRDSMINAYREQHFFPPARYFFQSKEHIESTQLFSLLQKMPKGGILHLHDAAAGDAAWVVNRVVSDPDAYVYWRSDKAGYTKGQIGYYHSQQAPDGFIQATVLKQQVTQFQDSLFQLITFDESIDADSVDIWKEFELVFQRIYGFIRYQPVFKDYVYHYFDQLVEDGVQHVELRSIISGLYDLKHPEGYYTTDSTVQFLQEVAFRIKEKEPAFSLKIIYTSLRFRTQEQVFQDLVQAYRMRSKYPNLIKGFDLVAEEDQGHTTLYFLDTWLKMDSLQQAYGIDMPLYLHDGESSWVSSQNLYDAVLLNCRRIGHGFNLFRFPQLMEQVRRNNICLEINPISNQVLGYVRDLRLHPARSYLARGIPCVISSDDPLIFNYRGLSYDFWEVFLAWELDLRKLKGLALNSLTYSALDEQEQKKALEYFNAKWSKFVDDAMVELGQ